MQRLKGRVVAHLDNRSMLLGISLKDLKNLNQSLACSIQLALQMVDFVLLND